MHTFLAIETSLFNHESKETDLYQNALKSNDGLYLLIDGYNEKGNLVSQADMDKFTAGDKDLENFILSRAHEYTYQKFTEKRNNPLSQWYAPQDAE